MAVRRPFFIVPESLASIATGNEAAGYGAAMLARHDAIGLTWRSSGASNLWVRGRFAGSVTRPIDFASLISATALPGTTIRLRLGTSQAQVDGTAPYDSGVMAFISPAITRSDGLYHSHLELPSAQNASWWRIDIGGHTGNFSASMLALGKRIEPARFYNFDFQYGVEDTGRAEFNRFGVLDTQDGVVLRTLDFTLDWMSATEWENQIRPMVEARGTSRPVYCCFDPEATAWRQNRTYMGIFRKAPFARGRRMPATFGGDFQILSFI